MNPNHYAEKLANRKKGLLNLSTIEQVLERRKYSIIQRLPQYDPWYNFITPEVYWGQFVDHCKGRNILNKGKRFCQDKLAARRLIECLDRCDTSIVFDGLITSSGFLDVEIKPHLNSAMHTTLLRFFFTHYFMFNSSVSLSGIWLDLINSNMKLLDNKHYSDLFLQSMNQLIINDGHTRLFNLFEKENKGSFLSFLRENLLSYNWFIKSEFIQEAVLYQVRVIYERNMIDQNQLFLLAQTLTQLNIKRVLLFGLALCILKIRDKFPENDNLKEQFRSICLQYIGDPQKKDLWHSSISSDQEYINRARKELIKWQNEKIAIQFFESMQFDTDRKSFWMKHIRDMDEVKILIYKPHIQSSYKLQSLFQENRETFMLSEVSSTSAILMKQKDYLFIEFSKHGNALFIYRNDSPIYSRFNDKTVWQSNDFKQVTSKFYLGRSSGRMLHHSGWQNNLKNMIRRIS